MSEEINFLYTALKPEIEALAMPLFDLSEKTLASHGNFLPHAAVLTRDRKIQVVAAAPETENGQTNSLEVLPLLHAGLRDLASKVDPQAIAVAENVTVTPSGLPTTHAIKVLFEHERGLTIALYLPYLCTDGKYEFGSVISVSAKPEVRLWR